MRAIPDWQKLVSRRNAEKGFHTYKEDIQKLRGLDSIDPETDAILKRVLDDYETLQIERKILLTIGELCEAQEELRAGKGLQQIYYNNDGKLEAGGSFKPEGFPIELADAQIRLWDVFELSGNDAEENVNLKHAYNETRAFKHGKAY